MNYTQAETIRRIMGETFYVGGKTAQHKEDLKKLGWKWTEIEPDYWRWIYRGLKTDPAVKYVEDQPGIYVGVCK